MSSFLELFTIHAERVEQQLQDLLQRGKSEDSPFRPERLVNAMQHSALNGGKRVRPVLLMECAALLGVPPEKSVRAAAALECIHCYSLVHDDLPAMDDDDLRRGKPTTHKAFDEATAILAGDSLLTLAFEILSREETHPSAEIRIQLVNLYSEASGFSGMAGGQMLDLEAESSDLNEQEINRLQSMKTGALIRCACEAGAILANAAPEDRKRLQTYGTKVGQAFQIVDDMLDVTSSTGELGKQTAKDAERGKGTLVEIHGLEKSRMIAESLLADAIEVLTPYGEQAFLLTEIARFVVERRN